MSKLWGYVLAGAAFFTAGVVFVWGVFTAGGKAERGKQAEKTIKDLEKGKKINLEVERATKEMDATDITRRLNSLS